LIGPASAGKASAGGEERPTRKVAAVHIGG